MVMKNPHVIWASVAIVFMLVAGVVTLAALNKDVVVLISLAGIVAVPVLSAFGVAIYQKMDRVQETTNGREDKLLTMVKELHQTVTELALQVKPAEAVINIEAPKPELSWQDRPGHSHIP